MTTAQQTTMATAGKRKKRRTRSLGGRIRDIPTVRWVRKYLVHDPFNFKKQRLFRRVIHYTMCSYERLTNVYELVRLVEKERLPGAFVECGVWKGGCAGVMAYLTREARSGRKTWLFDSFEGLPEPTEKDGRQAVEFAGGKANGKLSPIDECEAALEDARRLLFSELKLDERDVVIEKGWFQHTLPGAKQRIGPIAILRLDGDWYDSTKCCLENLYDNVVAGGFVIIDDYLAWEGCRRAVDEFLEARDVKVEIVTIDSCGTYFCKP
jgi:hypothetical protein